MTAAVALDAAPAAQVVKVASWNLQSCSRGLPGIVKELKALDAEVVALQEVDRDTVRSGRIDQAAVLAKEAGYAHFHFFPALEWKGQGHYGLALLSRHPLSGFKVERLPVTAGIEPRILASAVVHLPGGPLSVNVTHLSHRVTEAKLRVEQVQRIQQALAREPFPRVLLGDFNDTPGSKAVQALTRGLVDVFGQVGQGAGGTFPLPLPFSPTLRIDYVFTSEAVVPREAQVVETQASDHYALTARLTLPGRSPTASR